MNKQKIADLKQKAHSLELLLKQLEEQSTSRGRGLNMSIYSDSIQSILESSDIYSIISDGTHPNIQFEYFWRYAARDTPNYIRKINEYISDLESKDNNLEDS